MKKKSFTLLEVMVMVGLFTIIVVTVLHFFSHFTLLETHLEKNRSELLAKQSTHTELLSIFSHLLPSSLLKEKAHPISLFTHKSKKTKTPELFFFFDHGIDPESQFSGPVYGKIYIDDEKNLMLKIWPYPMEKEFPSRSKKLLNNVSHMSFEFVSSTLGSAPKKLWPKSSKTLPYLLKITLEQNENKISFAFFLGNEKNFIDFSEDKD